MKILPEKKPKQIPVGGNILVDLMPQSHKDIVAIRNTRRRWTTAVVVFFAACLIISLITYSTNVFSGSQLSAERIAQEQVDIKINGYAEINQALNSQAESNALLAKAAGTEIDWSKLVSTIESSLPSGTSILSMSVVTGGGVKDKNSSAISMNLSSESTFGYSDSLKAIQSTPGVTGFEIGGLTSTSDSQYKYSVTFSYDTSILTQRFEKVPEK